MRKSVAILLAMILLLTTVSVGFSVSADNTGSALPNTYAKLQKGENIHVGYFGGSVTNGYGVTTSAGYTQDKDSWRGKSLAWLNEQFPVAKGEEPRFYEGYHAGLGGSGTDLNLYRADRALGLDSDDPVDLLFIEFSINDSYEGHTYDKSAYYMESIIQKVRVKNPTCDIVVILTTDHNKLMASGTQPHMNAQAHIDVAEHYGIPYFWFGGYMYDFITGENGGKLPSATSELWYTYFMDGCHPNENGYTKYCEFLVDNFLAPNLATDKGYSNEVKDHSVPAVNYNTTEKFLTQTEAYHSETSSVYYNTALRTDAYDVFPAEIENSTNNYQMKIATINSANPTRTNDLTTTVPGASFSATVNGTGAGIFFKGHPTNGILQYRIDGGEWQFYNLYRSASNTNEHFMLFEGLKEKERTIDVILRRTASGSEFTFRGFCIEGDSVGAGVAFNSTIPNNQRIDDICYAPITLTPEDLNQAIELVSSSQNTGSSFEVYHLGVIDADVLRYTPNSQSSDAVASDGSGDTLKQVELPLYKYAVIDYYYDLEPGTDIANAVGDKQMLEFLQLGATKDVIQLYSADDIVLQQTAKSLVDLTAIGYRLGYEGGLMNMYIYPYGNKAGSDLVATEIMNIRSVTFYTEFPYEQVVEVEVDKTVTTDGLTLDLDGKKALPSAHRYVEVSYSADEATSLSLQFSGMYDPATGENTKTYTVSADVTAGEGKVILDLGDIATSGQTDYYNKIKLISDKAVTVNSLTFSVDYPDKTAQFGIIYDANGGEGTLPVTVGTVYTEVELADATLYKGDKMFYGWGATKDATTPITTATVTPEGTRVYAIYQELNTVYATSDGTGKVTYNGTEYAAPYTTLAEAVTALGAKGGRVVFSGAHSATALMNAQNASAPILVLEGADSTAQITMDTNQYKFKCSTEFRNLSFIKTGNDPYFYGMDGGKTKITLGENVAIYNADGTVSVFKGAMFGGDTEINSGYISNYWGGGTFGGNSSGNISIVFNGGTIQGDHYAGAGKFGALAATHTGNITTVINGGKWEKTNPRLSINMKVRSDVTTTVTGASSLIINHDLATRYGFQIFDYEYVIKSGNSGKATLAGEGSATTAPTYLLKADDVNAIICIDGQPVNSKNGEYLFTPATTGTYTVTYEAPLVGDLDNDDALDGDDMHLLGGVLIGKNTLTSADVDDYDVNADSAIDICDLVFLKGMIEDAEFVADYTVKHYDEFEGSALDPKWTSTANGRYTVSNGILNPGSVAGTSFADRSMLLAKSEAAVNQLIEVDFQRNSNDIYCYGPSVLARVQTDGSNKFAWGGNYYNIQLQLAMGHRADTEARMYIYTTNGGRVDTTKTHGEAIFHTDPNAKYRLRVSVKSNGDNTTMIIATLYAFNENGTVTQVASIWAEDTVAARQSAGTAGLSYGLKNMDGTTAIPNSGLDVYRFSYSTIQ